MNADRIGGSDAQRGSGAGCADSLLYICAGAAGISESKPIGRRLSGLILPRTFRGALVRDDHASNELLLQQSGFRPAVSNSDFIADSIQSTGRLVAGLRRGRRFPRVPIGTQSGIVLRNAADWLGCLEISAAKCVRHCRAWLARIRGFLRNRRYPPPLAMDSTPQTSCL